MRKSFDQPLTLQTLTGEPLDVIPIKMLATEEEVTFTLRLSFLDWQRALRDGLFHLDDEDEPPGFEPDLPVQLALRLRSSLAARWVADTEGLAAALQEPGSPLRHTEAWLATEILQEVEAPPDIEGVTDLQVGVRTRWANPVLPSEAEADTVIERLEAFLNDEDWPFARLEENILRFPAGVGEGRSWVVVAVADEENETCTIYSIHMKKVPASRRKDAAIWMAKKNYELDQGCFDMNTDTGEVRYRSTFPAGTRNQLTAGVKSNFSVMAANLDALAPFFEE